MKAVVCPRYGSPDVLRIEEVQQPTPMEDEVLVEVKAASLNAGDWHLMRGDPFLVRLAAGLRRPKHEIPGMDVAGKVKAVGRNVKRLQSGDEVFGDVSRCGFGAFAEYVAVPEETLALKPGKLTFEQAAAVPAAAVTALQGLRDKGKIEPGQNVLITGASGGVGTFAVQIAKAFGTKVTGVCSTGKIELVRSIGADNVIDYTREDFTRGGRRYDLILDAGAFRSVFDSRRALTRGGSYVLVGGATAPMIQAMLLGQSMLVRPNRADLLRVTELLESGEVMPVVDKVYGLNEVPDAIRYLEGGLARGKVAISVSGRSDSARPEGSATIPLPGADTSAS